MLKYLTLALILCLIVPAYGHTSDNTHKSGHHSVTAKKNLVKSGESYLFYSGCEYTHYRFKPKKVINTCGYVPRRNSKRSSRVELEHIVPASRLGAGMECWKKGGRKLCSRDPHFKAIAYDLNNLVLAIGELNGNRSNRKFGMLPDTENQYGDVDVKISFSKDLIQPRADIRGDIARIHYYMRWKYDLVLTLREERMFAVWHYNDPVSNEERQRATRIEFIQQTLNPFVH